MIRRDLYLSQLGRYIDKPLIKVITGIRRSGKSVILRLLKDELVGRGISEEQIIFMNFESFEFADIDTSQKLFQYVKSRTSGQKRLYLLLDEVQEVDQWEKAVNACMVDFDSEIYLTGSNSRLLSSELATYLAGRYVELQVFPLSFIESLQFRDARVGYTGKPDHHKDFEDFIRRGGFPVLHISDYETDTIQKVVFDIYSSALLRDTVQRYHIRDVELLERVVRFVFDNTGNKFSAQNIADYFKSQQRKIDLNTVYNYLNALESAYLICRIPRYDIKGREILKTLEKYYVGDHSLVYSVMGYRDRYISGILENIVMLELKRRGYQVYTGELNGREIDFVAEKPGSRMYVQVAYKLTEQSTIDREYTPLLQVRDHHPKFVVTMDEFWQDNVEGIRHMHVADFLTLKP